MVAFLWFRQGVRNLEAFLKCSSADRASCFHHSVLPEVLLASKKMQEKKKSVMLLPGKLGSHCLIDCLFIFFFPFIALFSVSSRQLTLSHSSG